MRNNAAAPLLATLLALLPATCDAAFATGDYFDSTSTAIQQFSPAGVLVNTITIPGLSNPNIHGLAFGPDGLLYAVAALTSGYEVVALNSAGQVQQTYTDSGDVGGNLNFGAITFDNSGHFYVGEFAGLSQFTIGTPGSGHLVGSVGAGVGVYGVTTLPDGDLLVATRSNIYELTTSGSVVRQIGGVFVDLTGIAYDPSNNAIYASILGSTGNFYEVMKIDDSTGAVLASTFFNSPGDIIVTVGGLLLVGSNAQSPAFFDVNLNLISQLPGGPALFVAATAPEPASLALITMGLSAVGVLAWRQRISARAEGYSLGFRRRECQDTP